MAATLHAENNKYKKTTNKIMSERKTQPRSYQDGKSKMVIKNDICTEFHIIIDRSSINKLHTPKENGEMSVRGKRKPR